MYWPPPLDMVVASNDSITCHMYTVEASDEGNTVAKQDSEELQESIAVNKTLKSTRQEVASGNAIVHTLSLTVGAYLALDRSRGSCA